MAKHELLNADEKAIATAQGWGLFYVHDQISDRWRIQALGLTNPNASATGAFVVALARQGAPHATKALQLIMESHK